MEVKNPGFEGHKIIGQGDKCVRLNTEMIYHGTLKRNKGKTGIEEYIDPRRYEFTAASPRFGPESRVIKVYFGDLPTEIPARLDQLGRPVEATPLLSQDDAATLLLRGAQKIADIIDRKVERVYDINDAHLDVQFDDPNMAEGAQAMLTPPDHSDIKVKGTGKISMEMSLLGYKNLKRYQTQNVFEHEFMHYLGIPQHSNNGESRLAAGVGGYADDLAACDTEALQGLYAYEAKCMKDEKVIDTFEGYRR